MSDMPPRPEREDRIHPLARPFLFLDRPAARDVISLCIVLIAMALFAADFFLDRHGETGAAETKGFFSVFGFAAFGLIVLSGWPLRALLTRAPDFYGESEDGNA